MITDDDIFEATESFTLLLSTSDPQAVLMDPSAVVFIHDDDGKELDVHKHIRACVHHGEYILNSEVTIMLNAPEVVPEVQQSVITACISIVGNTVIETEVRVMFSTVDVDQQGNNTC